MFNVLRKKNPKYWRTTSKAEVDFVVDGIPVEVKTSSPKISRSLRSFISSYSPKTAILLSWKKIGVERIDGTSIYFIPISYLSKL